MEKITREQLDKVLDEILAEVTEDYKYERMPDSSRCLYMHGDVPGCIIGTALFRLGVPAEYLHEHEGQLAHTLNVWADPETPNYVRTIQLNQDMGGTWHKVVESARS